MSPQRPPRRRRRRWLVAVAVVLVLLANLAFNPWFARWRSLALMAGYDQVYERDSVPHDAGVRAEMPLAGTGRTVFLNSSRISNPLALGITWNGLPDVPSVAKW